jgi:hypothetical protein
MLVIKMFNEFSSSGKKLDEVKEFFFVFPETEYSGLLCYVPTHFLSLFAATDRLFKH